MGMEVVNNGTENKVNIFPYSIFYVFYEQYLTMWSDTFTSLSTSILSVFIITFLLMGLDIVSSLIILVVIIFILADLLGLMYWWSVSLNAVSLVNLVMAVGISVEFCSHITRHFAINTGPTKLARAEETLVNMGSSVF